ncbi:MAG: hypothetical protein JW969_21420 [Spirochaetales bacterium]|nr:hypothetical protein [Spirochaetales bacterium]
MKKNKILLFACLVFLYFCLISGGAFAKDESIIALPGHALGDQTLALNLGLFIPLFFQDYSGQYYPANMTLGGTGSVQWNAYLSSDIRIGLELGGCFAFTPRPDTVLMMPFVAKLTYVFNFSRFEMPVYIGAGINLMKYSENIINMAILVKPGIGLYWRFDANLSVGLNCVWWWNTELPAVDNSGMMGNFMEVTPSLFYHF